MSSQPELIIALDVPSLHAAEAAVARLPEDVRWFKVGLELFTAEGPKVVRRLIQRQHRVFLDLKLHDIPRTVARSVRSAVALGVELLTVHAAGGRAMIEAAVQEAHAATPRARIVAVTVLTSLDETDLRAQGITRSPSDQVLALGELALRAGADGLVCSVHEAAMLRRCFGPEILLVTPGIRRPDEAVGDQKRVATPATAVRAGASHIVVGRPILEAPDPGRAAHEILAELRSAFAGGTSATRGTS